jgi:F-type H+-transporting ATPase subunit delta
LVRLDRAQRMAEVESAVPLSADLQANVQAGLQRVYGPELDILLSHRPALIGGMRIQVGSDVYDSSVRARLAALERSF